ncbi:DUF4011 domain-containing protein [Petrimonas sp.]|uniref:DUF4011 domain-containing protein n=1 Tax=Petrimonas sp. TaxID=2023866 RepID=UPI003F519381
MENALILRKETIPFLNISHYLNDILPIQLLLLENTAEEDSGPVEVRISSDIPLIEEFVSNIAVVPAGKSLKIPLEGLRINRNFLSSISESEKACIKIELSHNSENIITETFDIQVHSTEYFGGFEIFPELVASYVTPNHSYIYHIKRKAIEIMEKYGLKSAFEGYQSDSPERVLQMMSAIYSAIQSEEIVYSSLPPGYAHIGQRLRLLPTIKEERFGNCIDISLLFSACFEAIDLNPILIVTQGHAFVGCWLFDNKFPEITNDDKTAITKRLAKGIREIAVIEATTVCRGNNIDFEKALNIGEAQLIEKEDFILSVDIKRARSARIRPLPLVAEVAGVQLDEQWLGKHEARKMTDKFELGTIYEDELLETNQPKSKQKIWERKLLDLSLRNNLLNMRMSRNMLQLVDIDISHLEDTLADGRSFSIIPNPKAEVLRRYNLFAQALHPSSPAFQLANEELKANRLLTYYHQMDLDAILNHIHKNAKLSIEENGSSTLYLGVGLLKWFDRRTPEQARYAPILLLPVEISRRSVNSKYTLKSREEETLINITLLEFLRQEYELNLNVLDQLPYDDKGVDVPKVMAIVRRAVMQQKGWDVEEQLVLGNFSFNKLILWKDMTLNQEKLLESDIVKSLTEGRLTFSHPDDNGEVIHFENIPPNQLALPIPTDVSQMNAVLNAQQGKSFILHGPPGTGKSQTITNIIADALFHKKRVLFVAAKKAALDVVYNRLEQIGLGPFSLELHSNKSKKSDVLSQLERSLEVMRQSESIDFQSESERLQQAKLAVSGYVEALHERKPSGLSLFDSIVELESLKTKNFQKNFISEEILQKLDASLLQKWEDWLFVMQEIANQITHPKEHPFSWFKIRQISISEKNAIESESPKLLSALKKYRETLSETADILRFTEKIATYAQADAFAKIVTLLNELPKTPLSFCRFLSGEEQAKNFENWHTHFKSQQSALKSLTSNFNRNILQVDVTAFEMQWKQALQSWFLPKLLGKNKVKKQLALYKNSKWKNDAEVEQFFSEFGTWKNESLTLEKEHYKEVKNALGWLYREDETDLSEMEKRSEILTKIAGSFREWQSNSFSIWIAKWEESGSKNSDEITHRADEKIRSFLSEYQDIQARFENYKSFTDLHFGGISGSGTWIENAVKFTENINSHLPQLNSWMHYKNIVNEGKSLDLDWFVNDFENQTFATSEMLDYFHYTVHNSLARQIISAHESLHLFNVGLFENKIEESTLKSL